MTKEEFTTELKELNAQHDSRLGMMAHIINGVISDTGMVCVAQNECDLQKWFVKRKNILYKIYDSSDMDELIMWHEEWHDESEKLCQLFNAQKKSILSKVFGKKKIELKEGDLDIAMLHLATLRELTDKIDKVFKPMIKSVNGLSERAFRKAFET